MGGAIRLDIGAGHVKHEGWVRLDFKVERQKIINGDVIPDAHVSIDPHIECDLRTLPLPDDYADEARAIHVIEHFQPWEAEDVLREWIRVLKPGAQLAIECPCLDKIIKLFDVPNVPPWATFWGLYGDPRMKDPLMMHHWCYTERQLVQTMAAAGLEELRGQPPKFHQAIRDMRIVGRKPLGEPSLIVTE